MALGELLALLERDARAEIDRIAAAAEAEAAALEQEAAARAGRARAALTARLDAETAAAIRRGTAEVERIGRERLLTARSAALDRVFAIAVERLARLPLERYRDRLPGLVGETLRYLDDRNAELIVPPDVVDLVDPGPARVVGSAEAVAGVLGRSADGAVTVDNTFAERLRRSRPDLAIAVANRLAEDGRAVG